MNVGYWGSSAQGHILIFSALFFSIIEVPELP